jgi:hypothetical protein
MFISATIFLPLQSLGTCPLNLNQAQSKSLAQTLPFLKDTNCAFSNFSFGIGSLLKAASQDISATLLYILLLIDISLVTCWG